MLRSRNDGGLRLFFDALEVCPCSAHPSDPPDRISNHQPEIRDIPGDNGAGTNEAEHRERMAAHYRSVSSDRRTLADRSGSEFILTGDIGAWIVNRPGIAGGWLV